MSAKALKWSLFFCLLADVGFAQKSGVRGIVKDKRTQEALAGAAVFTEEQKGVTTGEKGEFELLLSPGRYILQVHFLGYQNYQSVIQIEENSMREMVIMLDPADVMLNTVVISASRYEQKIEEVSVSTEVMKPLFLENRNTYNIETAVKQLPGIDVNDGQVSIRGGSGYSYGAGSRVLALVDDMPLISADAGDIKFNYLPVENIAQVEVIKGSSSVIYGSSSLNGIINVLTADPTNKPETKINVFQGVYADPVRPDSTGNRRDSLGRLRKPLKWWGERANPILTGMDFSHGWLIDRFAYTVSGSALSDQGYKQGATEQRARISTKLRYYFNENKHLYAGVNTSYMWIKASYFLLWQNADSGALLPRGGLDTPSTTLNYFHGYRLNVDPYFVYKPSEKFQYSVKTRFFRTINKSITKQGSEADLYFMEYRMLYSFPRQWKISAGVMQQFNLVRAELYGDHEGKNTAAYLQVDKKWERWSLTFGMRGEYYKLDSVSSKADILFPKGIRFTKTATEWKDTLILIRNAPIRPVFRVGANYRFHKATYVRASFGQGYRFPSIAEKFVNTSLSSLKIFPNPSLLPETGWSAEIGVKQGFEWPFLKGYFDIAGFWMEYQNMIEFNFGQYYPDSLTNPTFFDYFEYSGFKSINISNTRINGVETSLLFSFQRKQWTIQAIAGYTYMNPINLNYDSAYRATFSDTSSNMLKYRFNHMFRSDIQIEYKKLGVGFSSRYNSFMVNIDRTFEEPLFGTIEASKILPGLKEYRKQHNKGYWVFDARIMFRAGEHSTVSLICNNLFNLEYMGRPGDIQPPRTWMLRYGLAF